ncbi:hypothetical protein PR048_016805 [Dryococelus australis]|uniref:Uncharacterized protein n=1 Tax=Dryococelus australis TaxID=614101 RepID=A0ABQ9H7Q5_9NEOP|nr:hypothetical protein PR048_016805 [Dryococelus australis]
MVPSSATRCYQEYVARGQTENSDALPSKLETIWILLASHLGQRDSIPGAVAPRCSHEGIVTDDAAGRRVFSGISRFPRPFIPSMKESYIWVNSPLFLRISRVSSSGNNFDTASGGVWCLVG